MECTYWPDYEKFLARWGMKSLTCALLDRAQPLFPLAAQMMVLGLPLVKGLPLGVKYAALLDTLGDEGTLRQFSDFLQKEGV